MIGNALFITFVLFLAMGLALLEQCRFLLPYRPLLLHTYGTTILAFVALLFLNVFTIVFLACRKFFLKDTGRKLAHLETQLRSGETISHELSRHLSD